MILKYALSELKAYPRYTMLFIVNISLGLFGLSLLQSFKSSIQNQVLATSRAQTGGDLVVSSRLAIPKTARDEVERIAQDQKAKLEIGEVKELFSMASYQGTSRLIQLHAQDMNLPFYGEIVLNDRLHHGGDPSDLDQGKNAWVYPEILTQFGMNIGDEISLNGQAFKVTASIVKDPTAQVVRGSMAPRVYIGMNSLAELGLIQQGSTVSYQHIYKIIPPEAVDEIEKLALRAVKDPAVRIESHLHVNESNSRALVYLGDYLGLIALIALVLSNVGTIYLFRSHLMDRLRDQAVLKMLGLTSKKLTHMALIQTMALGTCGAALSMAASVLLFPVLSAWSKQFLPFTLPLAVDAPVFAIVLLVGVCSTALCAFPLLRKLKTVSAAELFSQVSAKNMNVGVNDIWHWIPLGLFFFALAVVQSRSWKLGSLFCGLMLLSSLLLMVFGFMGLKVLEKIKGRFRFESRYAILEVIRRPLESLIVFVALSMGALLISLVFLVEGTLKKEFDLGTNDDQASMFLFDIQDEQLPGLVELTKNAGRPLQNISPIIRARLETTNGKPFERMESAVVQSREEETNERGRSRSYNLSERELLSTSETVSQGTYFDGIFDAQKDPMPKISLEEKFAQRMNLKIGDVLGFDVQGLPIQGKVVGLRKVRWASFQPNFFIQFQAGTFADFPKSYLASLGAMAPEESNELQRKIVAAAPGISMLSVSRIVERILEVSSQMSFALKLMAILVFFSAVAVFFSIGFYHEQRMKTERDLLHYIGLIRAKIRRIGHAHTWMICVFGLAAGWVNSFLIAIPITRIMFDHWPSFSWSTLYVFALLVPLAIYQGVTSK